MTLCIYTDNEINTDIKIPAFLFTIPSGLSFLCLISLMVYTLVKLLFNKENMDTYKHLSTYTRV